MVLNLFSAAGIFFCHSILFISLNVSAQPKSPETLLLQEKQKLRQLEYNWLKAEFALDTSYLSSLIDESFIGISSDGIKNKQQSLLEMYISIAQRHRDSIVVDSFKLEEIIINVYNSAGVVTFVVHTYGKNKGMSTERRTRFYDVWVKKGTEWKAVSSQGTRVDY
jgi:hypothetical protein